MGKFSQSRRCWRCDINWPYTPSYTECPGCNQETEPSELRSLGTQEAHAEKKRLVARREIMAKFEEYYQKRVEEENERLIARFRYELNMLPSIGHPLGAYEASGERPSAEFREQRRAEEAASIIDEEGRARGEEAVRDWLRGVRFEEDDFGMGC